MPQEEEYYDSRTAKEMQQEQIANDPNSVYADTMREEKVTNIIAQINPDLLLVDIEHRIRGEKKDPYSQVWVPVDPNGTKISEHLVANYISFLGAYLSQVNQLSNFSTREINNIMEVVIDYIRDDLSDNAELYGIEGKYNEWNRIGHIVCQSTFAVLKQAMNGMLAQRVFKALRVNESINQGGQKSKLDFLKFW